MRKWITLLMTLLVGTSVSYANASMGQVTLEAGYRQDQLQWKHALPSRDPIFETSSKFKDIDIFELGLRADATLGCNFYARVQGYWGWILDGDNQTTLKFHPIPFLSTFDDISLAVEANRENRATINDNYVWGGEFGIGYSIYFCDCSMMIAPVIGYSFDEQSIEVNDNGARFGRGSEFFSEGNCCETDTVFRWYGPWVGLDFYYRPVCECWSLWAEVEYHWGAFNGRRHHAGGIHIEKDKQHSSDMQGWVFAVGAEYDFCNCWTVGVEVEFEDFSANRHHRTDWSFSGFEFSDSFVSFSPDNRERHSFDWNSYAVKLTVGRNF